MSRPTECGFCSSPLPERSGPGRHRQFCSNSCRQRNYMRRVAYNGQSVWTLGERDNWRCHICTLPIDPSITGGPRAASIDHVIPVSRGGLSTADNLALAHMDCNRRKSAQLLDLRNRPGHLVPGDSGVVAS